MNIKMTAEPIVNKNSCSGTRLSLPFSALKLTVKTREVHAALNTKGKIFKNLAFGFRIFRNQCIGILCYQPLKTQRKQQNKDGKFHNNNSLIILALTLFRWITLWFGCVKIPKNSGKINSAIWYHLTWILRQLLFKFLYP